jgi:hypothetical protein
VVNTKNKVANALGGKSVPAIAPATPSTPAQKPGATASAPASPPAAAAVPETETEA